jgi:hypothetical protein
VTLARRGAGERQGRLGLKRLGEPPTFLLFFSAIWLCADTDIISDYLRAGCRTMAMASMDCCLGLVARL